MIPSSIKELFKDIDDLYLPKDDNRFDKFPGEFKIGQKIGWYYQEDIDYSSENNGDFPYKNPPFKGVVIPIIDLELNSENVESENCVVVIYKSPTEKCYPLTEYISFKRLINDENLIEIIKLDN